MALNKCILHQEKLIISRVHSVFNIWFSTNNKQQLINLIHSVCLSYEMISNGKWNSSTLNKMILTVILITTLFQFWYYSNVIEDFYDTIRDRSHSIYNEMREVGSSSLNLYSKMHFKKLHNGHPKLGSEQHSKLLTNTNTGDNRAQKVNM